MAASFRYPGSKTSIRNTIVSYFPLEGGTYIEPFAGRGNIFFLARENCQFDRWLLNDINTAPFLKALRDADLSELHTCTDDFEALRVANTDIARVLEPRLTVLGKGYEAGSCNMRCNNFYINNCYEAQAALVDVVIIQTDWSALDYTDAFVYLDPPYLESYTNYGQVDHDALLTMLLDADFDWVLSSYLNDLYINYLGPPIVTIEKSADMCNFNGAGKDRKLECLWSNL